jgi:hypothetical protein
VREVALARTGLVQPYLVDGTMARGLAVAAPEIDLAYRFY